MGIDETTREIVAAAALTTNEIKDSQVFKDLLEPVDEPIEQISADGAYDSFECYQQILER